jgi:CRISPR-associated protein Cmr2
MSYVLSLALGPVQDFLVAARRTRDLWFGSWLLSELARAAGETILAGGDRLIFPAASRLKDNEATFTNKLLAVIEKREPEIVALAVRAAIRKKLHFLRDEAFRQLQPLIVTDSFQASTADRQIDDLIEIQWAAASFDRPDEYADARKQAEALLGARKNTRLWTQPTWGANVPKSSIDGQRESVIHEDLFDGANGWSTSRLFETFRIGERERLCGVGLLKRLGRRKSSRFANNFLSTGHLAAWPLLERIKKLAEDLEQRQILRTSWQDFLHTITEGDPHRLDDSRIYADASHHEILGDLDASLLFEGRLSDLWVEEKSSKERRRRAEGARLAQRKFLKVVGAAPNPYFAILVADGDRMGRAIERIQDEKQHRNLSERLTRFADAARDVVEKTHHGELVLAGGDDVLAFVPLHRALACAKELADRFAADLKDFEDKDGLSPTLSVGIGIAHFMEPLVRSLDLARAAERKAKERRDSLAIFVDKRSGPSIEIHGRWGEIDAALKAFVELHLGDLIPDGMAFELRELAHLLHQAAPDHRPALEKVVERETVRILRRKRPGHGRDAGLTPETLKVLDDAYETLELSLAPNALDEFANQLLVARLLAAAQLQAKPREAA